jgi:8-oxo-dGTP diphosphatase
MLISDGIDVASMPLLVVAAVLVDRNQRVLVQRRPPRTSMAGLWEFPGGKIEVGETPEAALARELKEELSISSGTLTPLSFASEALDDRHLVLLIYTCLDWAGEPAPLHASAIKWVPVEALRVLPMPKADRPLIDSIERFVEQLRQ